jgi:hypothetical protein
MLIILGVVALLRRPWMGGDGSRDMPRETPLEILQRRYARGEI